MVTTPVTSSRHVLTAVAVAGLLASCGSGVGNAAPRVAPIPMQAATGGSTFSLDLAGFITDREGQALNYDVVSGGGDFTASMYSHQFDTMGTYTVVFDVSDGGKVTTSSFEVEVNSANFAVVRVDNDGLQLLDTDTQAFLPVTASSHEPSLVAGLARGELLYQLDVGGNLQLWVFDPATRMNTRLAEGASGSVTYRARTSRDEVLFTAGTTSDTDLWLYDPTSRNTRAVSVFTGEVDGSPFVNVDDLVFYERGVAGQPDVYYYDPVEQESTAVSNDAQPETIRDVLADGAVVFSRPGDGGEDDLYYYRVGYGLIEVGLDTPGLAPLHKTYGGGTSAGQVVFTAFNVGGRELYLWDPTNGQTTGFATGADYVFDAVTESDRVVYTQIVGGADWDLFAYEIGVGSTPLQVGAGKAEFQAVTSDGVDSFAVFLVAGASPNTFAVGNAETGVVNNFTDTVDVQVDGLLPSGNVVLSRVDGTAIALWQLGTGLASAATGTGIAYGGPGADVDDLTFTASVGGQDDLFLFDASASVAVTVSNDPGEDAFAAMTAAGGVLFTRVAAGGGNADLYLWDSVDLSTARLTDVDAAGLLHDHEVLGGYQAAR